MPRREELQDEQWALIEALLRRKVTGRMSIRVWSYYWPHCQLAMPVNAFEPSNRRGTFVTNAKPYTAWTDPS